MRISSNILIWIIVFVTYYTYITIWSSFEGNKFMDKSIAFIINSLLIYHNNNNVWNANDLIRRTEKTSRNVFTIQLEFATLSRAIKYQVTKHSANEIFMTCVTSVITSPRSPSARRVMHVLFRGQESVSARHLCAAPTILVSRVPNRWLRCKLGSLKYGRPFNGREIARGRFLFDSVSPRRSLQTARKNRAE